MVKCSFCGDELLKGTGKMFVKKEGTVFFFCSNKCEKNLLKLNRSAHRKKWTHAGQKERFAQKAALKKGGKKQ